MSKTVRIYNTITKETNVIPAAELGHGMVEALVYGVGHVWIKAKEGLKLETKHPPRNPKVRAARRTAPRHRG